MVVRLKEMGGRYKEVVQVERGPGKGNGGGRGGVGVSFGIWD